MNGWPVERLDKCCQIVSGATPSTSVREYWDGDIPWVTPKDLSELTTATISDTPRKLTAAGLAASSASLLPPGSVLFSSRAPIGHVAINTVAMATNQGFKSFVPNPDRIHAPYLYWWLEANRTYLQGLGNGATFKEVSKAVVSRIEIPVPPISEQRRIAAILDQADALRVKRRHTITHLDAVTQSIFIDLFRDTNSSIWKPLPLPECYWFQEGPGVRNWQFTDKGVKLLNVGNIEKNGFLNLGKTSKYLAEEEAYGKYKHFLVDPGDLVIASSGISFDLDGLLRTRGAFVSQRDLPLCMNTSTIRFKAIEGVSDLRFLWVWLGSTEFRSQITRRVTGSAQQNFGPSHLKSLTITLPPLSIQEDFATRVEAVGQLRSVQQAQQDELDSLFTSLQHRAFRGEL